jgi:DNA-binding beta-propeller fold protein YncE
MYQQNLLKCSEESGIVLAKKERTIRMKNHNKSLFWVICILLLTGCASSAPMVKEEPVFYPDPPELPRLQFLTSFVGSIDVEPKKTEFSKFVSGKNDIITRLDKPYGVAIQDGRIYVCDTNSTVIVFDLNKKTFAPLEGAQGRGKLLQPVNISIDKDGNKYVSDPVRGQVVMFDKNDFYVKAYGTPGDWKPVDAVVYEDKLYVADAKGEIKVFSLETGELVQTFGRLGEKQDWLGIPTNLAFDSEGFLYVSDAGRFQIVKLDRDGNFRGTIGSLGSQLGFFARPRGIALDKENRVFAVDAAFDNVQMFTRDGQLLFFFGKAGNNRGDMFLPAKVVVDYKNIAYFQQYADPSFEIDAIVLVTNQFGVRPVSVYGLGREKGKKYPTEEELKKLIEEQRKKLKAEKPEAKPDEGEKK